MSNIVPKQATAALPATFKDLEYSWSEFTGGVQSGFPVISYRGKVWRIRKGGVEEDYIDGEGDAVPFVELVFLKSYPQPSKVFYAKKWEEGSTEAPSCWSAHGDKPDPEVMEPVHTNCQTCPNNVWGSRITENGKKARACSDVRRTAVVFAHDLAEKGDKATVFLLRVPPASLTPLKEYIEKALAPRSIFPFAIVTKVGFDSKVSHPQFTFKPVRLVSDEEAPAVLALRENEVTAAILAESIEYAAVGTTTDGSDDEVPAGKAASKAQTVAPEVAPAAVPKAEKKKKLTPVEQEEVEEGEEIPQPTKAKKRPAPAPTEKPSPKVAVESKETKTEDFDSMLDSILGNDE